jgi:hypothetical protein
MSADNTDATSDTVLYTSISFVDWLNIKTAYTTMRLALCDIEGGVAATLQEARDIASRAVRETPPGI